MLEDTLAVAIREEVLSALSRVSDKIARLEVAREWPVSKALKPLTTKSKLRIVCGRPFTISDFPSRTATANAGEATEWRNDDTRNFPILIVGATTGTLDAGLKDVKRITRSDIVNRWKANIVPVLAKIKDLSKHEVTRLLEALFAEVRKGSLSATSLQEYLCAIEADPTVGGVNNNLWRLGLMVDKQSTDTGMSVARVRLNKEMVEYLSSSEDGKLDQKLLAHSQSSNADHATVAKAALAYRKTRDTAKLSEIDLATLQKLLKTPTRPAARSIDLFDLLNLHRDDAAAVNACLKELADAWDLEETEMPVLLEAVVSGRTPTQVKIEVTAEVREQGEALVLVRPWTGESDDAAILAMQTQSVDPEPLGEVQVAFSADRLRQVCALTKADAYLSARSKLRPFEPWLERNAFTLLLLKSDARDAVAEFLKAWEDLAEEACALDDAQPIVEMIQVLETVQGVPPGDEPSWAVLGPLHPYRLDPINKVVSQTVVRLNSASEAALLGDAVQWTLDRCYPAYPTIHRGRYTFSRTSVREFVAYCRKPGRYMPPAGDYSGLYRIFQAIDGFSPWLKDGVSTLVIDPPPGGAVARALSKVRSNPENRSSFVYHVATNDGLDSLDTYEGEVRYLPSGSSLDVIAKEFPDVNVILRFVGETAGDSAVANAAWSATRGTHLALELQEGAPSAFGAPKEPSIKIDPRAGNRVVLLAQKLFAKQSGGMPSLAVIRPLLHTDEAPTLSQLAAKTDWLVFAAPGPLGLVSPPTINHTLRFVGRSNSGVYGLYVYAADDMFPVRKLFDEYFKNTPVGSQPPEKSIQVLVDKAQQSTQAVLFASRGQIHAQVGALVALDIAQQLRDPSSTSFVLSLDDFGWTRAWLADANDGRRADFLVVIVNEDGTVIFRVVESKTDDSGTQVVCEETQTTYKQALQQVSVSSKMLKEITCAAVPTLDQDLRFSSLIEHLMAAVLSRLSGKEESLRKRVFSAVNDLSKRAITPRFEQLVVLTQSKVNAPQETKRIDAETSLVWAGAEATERAFGAQRKASPAVVAAEAVERVPGTGAERKRGPVRQALGTEVTELEVGPAADSDEEIVPTEDNLESAGDGDDAQSEATSSEELELARTFIAAARTHGVQISDGEPVYLNAGPTLFAFGMRMHSGSSVNPLKQRLQDIGRDIGIGDRTHLVDIENDAEPRTVKVLLPRVSRSYPSLPHHKRTVIDAAGMYLPLDIGQTIEGLPFTSTVESWPHLLIAGTSGSGKTEFLKTLLKQLSAFGSSFARVLVVDGKGDTDYLGLMPRAMFVDEFPDVQIGHENAVKALAWVEAEMERRREFIVQEARRSPRAEGRKGPDIFKSAVAELRDVEISPLIVVIDEFADIMLSGKKKAEEFENLVQRISQAGRSRLIHLVLATQRPDKETIRGSIKANLNARAVFRLPTQADSMTVLGHAGAERLLMKGDMLFQHRTGRPIRLQGYRMQL